MTDEQNDPTIVPAQDNAQELRPLTPEEQEALKQAQAFLNDGVRVANELMPIFQNYQVREVIYAMGIALGAQAKTEDELKNYIGTVIHVAQHQFFFGEKKQQEPVDASEAQPS